MNFATVPVVLVSGLEFGNTVLSFLAIALMIFSAIGIAAHN